MPVTDDSKRPPEPSRRQTAGERARAATRSQLLASGKVLFAQSGLHKVTTHDIAAHAGVAAGTFYNHFRDKEALFRVITDEAIHELYARLDAVAVEGRPLREGVRPVAEALVGFAEDHRDLLHILFSRQGDAAVAQAEVLGELASRMAEGRGQAVERGEMPATLHPGVLAQAVVGMWSRVLAWWAEDPSRVDRQQVIDTLTAIQLGGTHPAP